jgi:hypothetical protein
MDNKLFYVWTEKGESLAQITSDYLVPIAEKLSQVNDLIFAKELPSDADFSQVVNIVEPSPIRLPSVEKSEAITLEELLKLLSYPVGSVSSPLYPKDFAEGKLDAIRCYMVVWSDKAKNYYHPESGGYIGYDLNIFNSDKYPHFKGKAVINDIFSKWAYTHRKDWLELDSQLPKIGINKAATLDLGESVFVNTKIEPRPYWENYHEDILQSVKMNFSLPAEERIFTGIIMKNRFHHFRSTTNNTEKVEWRSLNWI